MFDYRWRELHIYRLLPAVARRVQPKSYLEIGVWKGASVEALVGGYDGLERIVVCDPLFGHCGGPNDPGFLEPLLRKHGYNGQLHFLHGWSGELLPLHFQLTNETFDLSFIDGGHSYAEAAIDFDLVIPRSRVTLVHDLDHDQVWDALRDYLYEVRLPFWVTAEKQGTAVIFNDEVNA